MTCPCCAEIFATRYTDGCPDCGSSVEEQRLAQSRATLINVKNALLRARVAPDDVSGDLIHAAIEDIVLTLRADSDAAA